MLSQKNNFNIKSALLGCQRHRDHPCRRNCPPETNRMMFVQQKNTPTVKTHAPLKRNTCSSIGDRKAQRLTNLPTSRRKAPCNIKLVLPRISKECHYLCAELHCVTCGNECPYRTRNVDLASEWHLNLDKDPRAGEHHTSQQDSLLTRCPQHLLAEAVLRSL